ncbi:MAG: HNH endonuclease [Crocinitomicaceae bacterium]|nr:HNH endonuclease [Crocinitomicaceae bacterium]
MKVRDFLHQNIPTCLFVRYTWILPLFIPKLHIYKPTLFPFLCYDIILTVDGKRIIKIDGIKIFKEGSDPDAFNKFHKNLKRKRIAYLEERAETLRKVLGPDGLAQLQRSGLQVRFWRNQYVLTDEAGNILIRRNADTVRDFLIIHDLDKYSKMQIYGRLIADRLSPHSFLSKKAFDPSKPALREAKLDIRPTERGLSPDFRQVMDTSGRTPRKVDGVLYKKDGVELGDVQITLGGSDTIDFRAANKAAGLCPKRACKTPKGYTWHHLDDFDPRTGKCTMQLVKSEYHILTSPHIGGASLWSAFHLEKYKERALAVMLGGIAN